MVPFFFFFCKHIVAQMVFAYMELFCQVLFPMIMKQVVTIEHFCITKKPIVFILSSSSDKEGLLNIFALTLLWHLSFVTTYLLYVLRLLCFYSSNMVLSQFILGK